jgi:glycerophosphoryl diester phosphodiesterase
LNTVASFEAAVEAGVDMIELDVLWLEDGDPRRVPDAERSPLVVAHDWHAAAAGPRLTLAEALDAFTRPPLNRVEIDCDVKLPGREAELVVALRDRGLVERAMVSTMERSTLEEVARLEPGLRRGWTFPKVKRDWTRMRWAAPAVLGALAFIRLRLPRIARNTIPALGVEAMWVYHPLITPRLARAVHGTGAELIAWTVDEPCRMQDLATMGVDGICSNYPSLFEEAEILRLRDQQS